MLHSPLVWRTRSDYLGSQVSLMLSPLSFSMSGNDTLSLTNLCHPEERSDERQTKIPTLNKNTIGNATRPRGDKLFSCSTQLSTKFVLFITIKMPTIIGILIVLA